MSSALTGVGKSLFQSPGEFNLPTITRLQVPDSKTSSVLFTRYTAQASSHFWYLTSLDSHCSFVDHLILAYHQNCNGAGIVGVFFFCLSLAPSMALRPPDILLPLIWQLLLLPKMPSLPSVPDVKWHSLKLVLAKNPWSASSFTMDLKSLPSPSSGPAWTSPIYQVPFPHTWAPSTWILIVLCVWCWLCTLDPELVSSP